MRIVAASGAESDPGGLVCEPEIRREHALEGQGDGAIHIANWKDGA